MTSEKIYLDNIKNYIPKFYQLQPQLVWHKVPVSRRSSVFVLLFLGNLGELRVILTKRSSKLRNFPGHISLPGGKADSSLETEWQVARREMEEEIGLSSNNDYLLKNFGFTIDYLNILPSYLSRTFSSVRPCIGFMNFHKNDDNFQNNILSNLNLSLNPGESSSIFSCPLKDFLYPISQDFQEALECTYHRVKWGGVPWKLRSYIFKQNNPYEVAWLKDIDDLSSTDYEVDLDDPMEDVFENEIEESSRHIEIVDQSNTPANEKKKNLEEWGRLGSRLDEETNEKVYDVWGLTANILHDLAQLTYTNKFNHEMGEEELIYSIWRYGNQMKQKSRSPEEVKLINSHGLPNEFGFNDILPRSEFLKLKQIYKL